MKGLSVFAAALAFSLLAGCRSRVDECNALVRVINDNHSGEIRLAPDAGSLPQQLAAQVADMRRDVDYDVQGIAALRIMNPQVPEVRKLRDSLQAGFQTRLDGEEIILASAEVGDVDKAKTALARVNTSAAMLKDAYASVSAFCGGN